MGEGSGMDKERARELASSPAKRHQGTVLGHTINYNSSNKAPSPPGSSPSVLNNDTNVRVERDTIESRKAPGNTEENGGDVSGNSGEDDPSIFHIPPAATTRLSSRKRVRLHGKVSEDCNPVDPSMVPRRLRSAINKRSCQSASPPLPDSKRKQHRASNGTQHSIANGLRRFKQSMLAEPITKDEEEVAETLSDLASLITVSEPNKEGKRASEDEETKATSVSLSEASKEGGVKFLLPCTGTEASNPTSCVEESTNKIMKAEPSVKEQPSAIPRSQIFYLELNGTSQPDFPRTPTPKNDQAESTCSRDAMKSLDALGTSLHLHSGIGVMQPTNFNPLTAHKPTIGLWPSGSASVKKELQSVKQKPDDGAQNVCWKETTADVRLGFSSNGYENSTKPSSSKATVLAESFSGVARSSSTGNDLATKKLSPLSADRKRSSKRCTTHVHISLLIQNYQNFEKKQRIMCPSDQVKVMECRSSGIQALNETVGSRNVLSSMSSAGANGPVMERNMHEARTLLLKDGKLLQAQEESTVPQSYAQQKQVCEFLSLSAANETGNLGNVVKSSEQLHIPYQHSQAIHHSTMPFPFPHVPYTSPYPDQLAAAVSQQVLLQLPHYLGNPLYGQHMVHAGGTIKQQQQMWQAQMVGNMGIPKWPNGRQQEATSLLLSSAQPPPIFPTPPEILTGAYYHSRNPQQYHQLLPIPSSSSSQAKQQHQHNGVSRFGPEGGSVAAAL